MVKMHVNCHTLFLVVKFIEDHDISLVYIVIETNVQDYSSLLHYGCELQVHGNHMDLLNIALLINLLKIQRNIMEQNMLPFQEQTNLIMLV